MQRASSTTAAVQRVNVVVCECAQEVSFLSSYVSSHSMFGNAGRFFSFVCFWIFLVFCFLLVHLFALYANGNGWTEKNLLNSKFRFHRLFRMPSVFRFLVLHLLRFNHFFTLIIDQKCGLHRKKNETKIQQLIFLLICVKSFTAIISILRLSWKDNQRRVFNSEYELIQTVETHKTC